MSPEAPAEPGEAPSVLSGLGTHTCFGLFWFNIHTLFLQLLLMIIVIFKICFSKIKKIRRKNWMVIIPLCMLSTQQWYVKLASAS